MATTIRIMISSRCNDPIDLDGKRKKLSDLRYRIKEYIENVKPFGEPLYECWINEDAPPADASEDSWEHCLKQVRQAHLVIVLYNGNAGWATNTSDIGICHAELATGLDTGRAKVYLIELPTISSPRAIGSKARNSRFQNFVREQNLFRGQAASTGDEVIDLLPKLLHEATVELAHLGVREARKGRYDTGAALDWSRLSLVNRQNKMREILEKCIREKSGNQKFDDELFVSIEGITVLVTCDAIPASMSTPAARELVGRPFVRDFTKAKVLDNNHAGPVHIIGCHKGVTENQAVTLLGHPDVTIVTPPFGVYAVDNFQQIQVLLLANCRDETTTRHAVQRAFKWLEISGESEFLVRRAKARRNIVRAIAKELTES